MMVVAKMSEGQDTIVGMMKVCPMHEGAFDCNPFCRICEGSKSMSILGSFLVIDLDTAETM